METEQKSNGALTGLIIVIIILILGGIYFWRNSVKEKMLPENSSTGSIDTASGLDANVNNLDLDNLDSGI